MVISCRLQVHRIKFAVAGTYFAVPSSTSAVVMRMNASAVRARMKAVAVTTTAMSQGLNCMQDGERRIDGY